MVPYSAPQDASLADSEPNSPDHRGANKNPSARPNDAPKNRNDRKKRAPRKVSEVYLERAAHHHLGRYGSSVENLRQVLRRKVRLSRAHHGGDTAGDEGLIQSVLDRCIAQGLLDDRRYADALMTQLRRRGGSRRQIAARMQAKGISSELCRELLAGEAPFSDDEETRDAEAMAARRYARRRRLGPYRSDSQRQERRQRDLAAMARAGFDYDTATSVIDADSASDDA
jgi:regulatory protein